MQRTLFKRIALLVAVIAAVTGGCSERAKRGQVRQGRKENAGHRVNVDHRGHVECQAVALVPEAACIELQQLTSSTSPRVSWRLSSTRPHSSPKKWSTRGL